VRERDVLLLPLVRLELLLPGVVRDLLGAAGRAVHLPGHARLSLVLHGGRTGSLVQQHVQPPDERRRHNHQQLSGGWRLSGVNRGDGGVLLRGVHDGIDVVHDRNDVHAVRRGFRRDRNRVRLPVMGHIGGELP